jgi:hypothetical protein
MHEGSSFRSNASGASICRDETNREQDAMTRRIVVAAAYSLFVLALLLTWPKWDPTPRLGRTVITGTESARWLLIFMPFLWGWVAFYLEDDKWRKRGLIGSVLLFVVCFLFIWAHDNLLTSNPCLWYDTSCGSRWFR